MVRSMDPATIIIWIAIWATICFVTLAIVLSFAAAAYLGFTSLWELISCWRSTHWWPTKATSINNRNLVVGRKAFLASNKYDRT
jgi:hypothetical protein